MNSKNRSKQIIIWSVFLAGIILPFISPALVVDVTDYGAVVDDSNDDSSAFQSALNAVINAGGGGIFIPSGSYEINTRVSGSPGAISLLLFGDGVNVTRLYCNNSSGVFQLVSTSSDFKLEVRDMTLYANNPGSGSALICNFPSRGSGDSGLYVQNVEIIGNDESEDYFYYGIRSSYAYKPTFVNVLFGGPFGPGATNVYSSIAGFEVANCDTPSFRFCYSWSNKNGYNLNEAHGAVTFVKCYAVTSEKCVSILNSSNKYAQASINGCHFNGTEYGIKLKKNISGYRIDNCLMYHEDGNNSYQDIRLEDCDGGTLTGNIFHYDSGATGRKNISIDSECSTISIKKSVFNTEGIPVYIETGASGITTNNNVTGSVY